jgi:3-methyladenine DNA glycosylase AlkD
MTDVILKMREELKENSNERNRTSGQRYFKEAVNLYGVSSTVVTKIGRTYFSMIKHQGKTQIWARCEQLWQSGLMEEAFIACDWSYLLHKNYKIADLDVFERWLSEYVTNWAACDTFCNHTMGTFMEMYPECVSRLKRWTTSKNRWMRRGAAVSLIIPARKGLFLADIFEIADRLLLDEDDLVQKGYGWMLKAASQAQEKPVFDYVMKHKKVMPRTALRYAIEKMPQELRKEAMAK